MTREYMEAAGKRYDAIHSLNDVNSVALDAIDFILKTVVKYRSAHRICFL